MIEQQLFEVGRGVHQDHSLSMRNSDKKKIYIKNCEYFLNIFISIPVEEKDFSQVLGLLTVVIKKKKKS